MSRGIIIIIINIVILVLNFLLIHLFFDLCLSQLVLPATPSLDLVDSFSTAGRWIFMSGPWDQVWQSSHLELLAAAAPW